VSNLRYRLLLNGFFSSPTRRSGESEGRLRFMCVCDLHLTEDSGILPDTWLADLVLVGGSRSAPAAPLDPALGQPVARQDLPSSFWASVRGRSIRVGWSTTGARRTGPSHRSNEDDSLVPPDGPLVPPQGQRLTRAAISCALRASGLGLASCPGVALAQWGTRVHTGSLPSGELVS
jgi:hypothetical protein